MPTTIDWATNETNLPVPDEDWFNGHPKPSCRLTLDPQARWQGLKESGNDNGQAWFVILNSYKYEAMAMVLSPGRFAERHGYRATGADGTRNRETEFRRMRDLIQHCATAARQAVPESLHIDNNEFLHFRLSSTGPGFRNTDRIRDHHRYAVQIIGQVSEFILYGRDIYQHAHIDMPLTAHPEDRQPAFDRSRSLASSWQRYYKAADVVTTIIRNCARDHVRYVNANTANAIWFAAAAQIVARLLGPPTVDRQVARENFALLRDTISRYVDFWGVPSTLIRTLDALEERLTALCDKSKGRRSAETSGKALHRITTSTIGSTGSTSNTTSTRSTRRTPETVTDATWTYLSQPISLSDQPSTPPPSSSTPASNDLPSILEQPVPWDVPPLPVSGWQTAEMASSARTSNMDGMMGVTDYTYPIPDLNELFLWSSGLGGESVDLDAFMSLRDMGGSV